MARYDNITIVASSNTTVNSTGALQLANLTVQGLGVASVGYSNSKLLISVPAGGGGGGINAGVSTAGNTAGNTSIITAGSLVLVGINNVTLSQTTDGNGATVSIIGPAAESRFVVEPSITQVGTVQGNSLVSIVPFRIPYGCAVSNVRFGASLAPQTTTNNSTNMVVISASLVLYSLNGSTLSSLNSGSNTWSATWTSNGTSSLGGVRAYTVNFASATTVERGEYWLAVHMSSTTSAFNTSGTSNLTVAQSMLIGVSAGTAAMGMDPFGQATQATRGASIGLGLISTGATLASMGVSLITQSGTRAMVAKLWLDFRNYSLW